MGLELNRTFASLYEEDYAHDVARSIADRVGEWLYERVRERTPVADLPAAYKGDMAAWVSDRGGRKPGTLRDRWRRTAVLGRVGHGLKVIVFNPDPVAPHVEWNTRPHLIRAKQRVRADGSTYQGLLRYPMGPVFQFSTEIWHPGTQGQYPMRNSLAELEAGWTQLGEQVLDLYAAFYDSRYA